MRRTLPYGKWRKRLKIQALPPFAEIHKVRVENCKRFIINAVEGYHRVVRKFTKTKAIFPTDDSIRKAIYMSTKEISKQWIIPVRDWGLSYAQFTIFFEDRVTA